MTWNIGYAELEDDSRAHTKDLQAVPETILRNDPEAVALQELTGAEQLKILLGYLHGRYGEQWRRRATLIASTRCWSRIAMLVLNPCRQTENSQLPHRFHPRPDLPKIVFVSAHAIFSAARRRVLPVRW